MSRTQIANLTLVACLMFAPLLLADEIRMGDDGWYRWEVPAGSGGQNSCCYSFNNGTVVRKGCRLGYGMDEFSITEPCDETSGFMQVFVEVRNGRVQEIRPLSSACPVQSESKVTTFEDVTEDQSVAWLKDQIAHNPKMADEAVMALSFHTRAHALESLFALLEDRNQRQDTRKQALFWLVQSDYDEAFAYLDELLD